MTRRRKAWTLVALLVAALATLGLIGWRRGKVGARGANSDAPEHTELRRDPSARVARASLPYAPLTASVKVPWAFEPGLAPRRIAGIVRAGGVPAVDARVELRVAVGGDPSPFANVTTGADGRFDFGEVPAAHWLVMAAHAEWSPGSVHVQSGDPDARPAPDALELELGPCDERLRGVVVDMARRPIAGAELRDAYWVEAGAMLVATTGVDGKFDICALEGFLRVSASGHETRDFVPRLLRHDREIELQLFGAGALTGKVVDADGKPVSSAFVSGGGMFDKSSTVLTGPDGSFRLEGLGPGRAELDAEHPDHGSSSGTSAVVAAGRTTEGVLIELTSRCRRISGYVRMAGQPVTGAWVIDAGAFTQRDGSFVVRCASAEPIDVHVNGYVVVSPRRIPAGRESLDDLVVEVKRGAIVRGRVTDGGAPAKQAWVSEPMTGARAWTGRAVSAVCEPDGRYELAGLEPGTIELRATAKGSRQSPSVSVEITGAGEQTVDFEVGGSGAITGTVRDGRGSPLSGFGVRADDGSDPDLRYPLGLRSLTDKDGTFEIEHVPPGRYELSIGQKSDGIRPVGGKWPTVEVSGTDRVEIDLRIEQHGDRVIAGVVRYADGSPAAGARVTVDFRRETVSDTQGAFRVEGLVRDTIRLRALGADGATAELEDVRTGDEHVVVVLPRLGAIDGTIASSGDDWDVRIVATGADARTRRGWTSDVRGTRFNTGGLAPGPYKVQVLGPAGTGESTVEVRPGETARVTIAIGGTATIRGVARTFPNGAPAADLECSTGGAGGQKVHTAADGSFVLESAPAGRVEVSCRAQDLTRFGVAEADVAEGGTASIEVSILAYEMDGSGDFAFGDLGARLQPVPGVSPAAVAFSGVKAGGPAANAGLVDGDVVVTVDGAGATGPAARVIAGYIATRGPGARVTLVVRRAGAQVTASVTLGTPAAP